MKEKGTPEPTKEEVERALEGIEKATLEEEGKSLKREIIHVPKMPEPQRLWPKKRDMERKEDFAGKVMDWLNENKDYNFKNFDPEKTEIIRGDTDWIPPQLLDFLISNAEVVLERKYKRKVLGTIAQIEVKFTPPRTKDIVILVRDVENKTGEFRFWTDRPNFPASFVQVYK